MSFMIFQVILICCSSVALGDSTLAMFTSMSGRHHLDSELSADILVQTPNSQLMAELSVDLGTRSYPIYIGSGFLNGQNFLQHIKGREVLIVTNNVVGAHYLSTVETTLRSVRWLNDMRLPQPC